MQATFIGLAETASRHAQPAHISTEQLPTCPDFMPGHAQTAQNIAYSSVTETKSFGHKYE